MDVSSNCVCLSTLHQNSFDSHKTLKLCRKYKVPRLGRVNESMELVFADVGGRRIQATVESYLVNRLLTFYPNGVPLRILFHSRSNVRLTSYTNFPVSNFNFTNFSVIGGGLRRDDDTFFDVIAEVIDIKKQSMSPTGRSSVLLLLEDSEKKIMPCVLWGLCNTEFDCYANLFWNNNDRLVIILQLCQKCHVGLTTVQFATKIVVEQDIDKIVSYKLGMQSPIVVKMFDGTLLADFSLTLVRDELLLTQKNVMVLEDIRHLPVFHGGRVWVVGKISNVYWERNWYRSRCLQCRSTVCETYSRIYCHHCRVYIATNAEFVIHVKVVDGINSNTFLLIDDVARQMIGHPASDVILNMLVESVRRDDIGVEFTDCVRLGNPIEVEKLIGSKWVFGVVPSANIANDIETVYVVDKVWEMMT